MRRLASALVAAVIVGSAATAVADPSVWASAREPALERTAALAAEVDRLVLKYRQVSAGRIMLSDDVFGGIAAIGELYLREARELLEKADAARSPDPAMRMRLGEVLYEQEQCALAVPVLASVAAAAIAAPMRAEAWKDLAVCYARLGRAGEEIAAYDEALALEPHGAERSLLLANQAESYMLRGELSTAIRGYRAALQTLSSQTPLELARYAPTTYWGLAVALDRSGDLAGAFEAIRLARTYDPADRQLRGPGWFYVPPYDEAWFTALGAWAAAREATLASARAEAYQQAVASWESYLVRAPATDRWLPIARARLRACDVERRAALRRARGAR